LGHLVKKPRYCIETAESLDMVTDLPPLEALAYKRRIWTFMLQPRVPRYIGRPNHRFSLAM
jgi:hypothetical protein